VLIPLGALAIYFIVGTPAALSPENVAATGAPHAADMKELEVAVERLAARLKDNPDDTEGWIMLARSYKLFSRFPEAAQAYAVAADREPRNAALLADYADVLAMAQGRRLEGEPEKLIARALEADPRNLKALALAGTAAFEKKDYAGAVAQWERMLPLVPAGSDEARSVQASIDEARSLGGKSVVAQAAGPKPGPEAAPPFVRAAVTGTVTLAPELAAKVKPEDTVFIFARASEGPRMPLALVRKQARELPVSFTLDDTSAMTPEMKLSNFTQIVVGARISKSGAATSQPGDLEGVSAPVDNNTSGISVVIKNEIR
jgi:cytochrome c-type biogenesis protein CcmH